MIIDDGTPDRYHRKILFNPVYKYFGIGIGNHSENKMCTVLDYVQKISSYQNKPATKP